jgi:hypothetical protein
MDITIAQNTFYTVSTEYTRPSDDVIPTPDVPASWIGAAKQIMEARLLEARALRQTITVKITAHTPQGNEVVERKSTWFPVVPPPAMGARVAA